MNDKDIKNILQNKITRNNVDYFVTIGLEVHAEMSTATKMWCACKNEPLKREPNLNICPICMAHPGTLPVPNKVAMQNVVKVGLSINAQIADFTEFDRKNYFYPDIPKGYQISQYKYPLVLGGHLAGVDITRIHLEEDTAKSTHDSDDSTLVDFNRAGVPLMELVTEPVIHDTETIVTFAKELQLLLKYLDVSDADMEKGQMRIEVNVSISKSPTDRSKAYVECKNINSFAAAKSAAEYEIDRMINLYEAGRESEIIKETRGWDENKKVTKSQRNKENAEDYRYFPDPDITKFYLKGHTDFNIEMLRNSLPELPSQKRERLTSLGIKSDYIDLFIDKRVFGDYFDEILKLTDNQKDKKIIEIASNYIGSDLISLLKSKEEDADKIKSLPSPVIFLELMSLIDEEKLSSRAAKDLLSILVENKINNTEESPEEIANKKDLMQISDEARLSEFIKITINDEKNSKSITDYKAGKEQALMSLVGQVIKNTNGRANPSVTKSVLIKIIN